MTFDWATIVATPMPPPAENEQWRERRRAERAVKQAQRADDALSEGGDPRLPVVAAPELAVEAPVVVDREPQPPAIDTKPTEAPAPSSEPLTAQVSPEGLLQDPARKRRRRGGRRRRGRRPLVPGDDVAAPADAPSTEPVADADATKSFEPNDE